MRARAKISFADARGGFTLLELLVVVAVIGVLVSLLMPAVQQSRESARITQCRNNLKQIGLATHNFHDVRGAFPPGRLIFRPGEPHTCGRGTPTWLVRILPFHEEGNFFDDWDIHELVSLHPLELRQRALRVYLCPSRRDANNAFAATATVTMSASCGCSGLVTFPGGATVDYAGNHGDLSPGAFGAITDFYWGGNGTGVIISSRPLCDANRPLDWVDKIRFRNLIDGASSTLLAGELHIPYGKLNSPPENTCGYNGWHMSASMRIGGPGVPIAPGPNYVDTSLYSFGCWHPGGCNFVLADGSVRTINNNIDTITLGRLCNRADGLPVDQF